MTVVGETQDPGGAGYEQAYAAMTGALDDFTVAAHRAVTRSTRVMICLVVFVVVMSTAAVLAGVAVHRLYDCTVAGGGCFQRSAQRQADAIRQLNEHADRSRLLVGMCDKRTSTAAEFRACVLAGNP